MSVLSYLESEILEKRRAVFVSSLLRKFDHKSLLEDAKKFLSDNNDKVSTLFTRATSNEDGTRVISLTSEKNGLEHLFSIKPIDSAESDSAMWKRDLEDIRTEMTKTESNIWEPKFANIGAANCLERQIAIAPSVVTTSKSVTTNGSSTTMSKSGNLFSSSQKVASKPTSVEKKTETTHVEKKPLTKFQVPLDRLDDPDSELPTDKKRQDEDDEEMKENSDDVTHAAPEVAVSPSAKRQRTDTPMEEVVAESIASSSEPQYREVVIKKKVIVTEYEMGPNGEMIVKDVEKMVEETKMELVKPPSKQPSVKSIGSSSQSKKEPKPAKAGQATLTGFFKPKN